jgi:hypothetical protein
MKEVKTMAYNRGDSKKIIVGAASFFVADSILSSTTYDPFVSDESYRETLQVGASEENNQTGDTGFRNIGYTMNGLEIQFQPDFGEVQVDQLLDVAKLYKQGMQVNLNTAFAEATLENLLVALAYGDGTLSNGELNLSAGELGECPVERGIVAVGPGTGDCEIGSALERVYIAYRALSIENVTVSAKRDEASMFEVSFRLLPDDADASYGKIIDRTITASAS